MPVNRDYLALAFLFLSVPLQYFAVEHFGSNEVTRTYAISQLVSQFKTMSSQWLRVESWQRWCYTIFKRINNRSVDVGMDDDAQGDLSGESPAFEVLKYRDRNGHFGQSAEVRDPKPPHVRLRVGQVVKHKLFGYHGVIVGWDVTARAPEPWLAQMHGSDHPEWRTQPNYAILVDTRDRPVPQLTYVPQENIVIVNQVKVLHPSVDEYFEKFDGSQYLPRPWLKGLYPRD